MKIWVEDDVVANDVRIHYYRTGGNKPPLVLSHGRTEKGLNWTRVAQSLEKDYDVIMVDARGHGLSEAPPENTFTWENMAADLACLIQALDLEKPGLIGNSMGARVSALVAAHYPDLVGYLILEDPPWREGKSQSTAEERAVWAEKNRAAILKLRDQTRTKIIKDLVQNFPSLDETDLRLSAEAKMQVSPNIVGLIRSERAHWSEIVPKITCPTLLITGDPEAGSRLTANVAQKIIEMNANFRVVHIPGAGHLIRRDQFEPFILALIEFLGDVSKTVRP